MARPGHSESTVRRRSQTQGRARVARCRDVCRTGGFAGGKGPAIAGAGRRPGGGRRGCEASFWGAGVGGRHTAACALCGPPRCVSLR